MRRYYATHGVAQKGLHRRLLYQVQIIGRYPNTLHPGRIKFRFRSVAERILHIESDAKSVCLHGDVQHFFEFPAVRRFSPKFFLCGIGCVLIRFLALSARSKN